MTLPGARHPRSRTQSPRVADVPPKPWHLLGARHPRSRTQSPQVADVPPNPWLLPGARHPSSRTQSLQVADVPPNPWLLPGARHPKSRTQSPQVADVLQPGGVRWWFLPTSNSVEGTSWNCGVVLDAAGWPRVASCWHCHNIENAK